MFRTMLFAAMITSCIAVSVSAQASDKSRPEVALFRELQSTAKTDSATQQLIRLGRKQPEIRTYLADKLPILIQKGPDHHARVWLNAVRVAGELQISSASASLARWIAFNSGGSITFAQVARLELNPAGKALSQIGDPAVPTLERVLKKGDENQQWVAVWALAIINSPRALRALEQHAPRERNAQLRSLIDKILKAGCPR